VLCGQRTLRRANHSARGVLHSVCVCVCVCFVLCDQVQQQPSTPSVGSLEEVRIQKQRSYLNFYQAHGNIFQPVVKRVLSLFPGGKVAGA
jgi:hypothetical protein